MEVTFCPLCNKNSFDIAQIENQSIITRTGTEKYPVVTVICKNCGHVFSNPRPDPQEIKEYYTNYYREDFGDAKPSSTMLNLYSLDVNWINSRLKSVKSKRLLEIGCYMGYMLLEFKKSGWDVYGVEPTTTAATIAREKYGLPVKNCFFEELNIPENEENKYDLIVMGAVLEHIPDPLPILLRINQFLKPEGYLFIRVPNVANLILDSIGSIFTNEHPNMFSPDALRMFYQKGGFKEMHTTVHTNWPRHIISLAKKVTSTSESLEFDLVPGLYNKIKDHLNWYNKFLQEQRKTINAKLEHLWYPIKKSVILYGAGKHSEFLLEYTSLSKANILGLSDSNQEKWNKNIFNLSVYPPEEISRIKPDAVVIASRAFQDDIFESIKYLKEHNIEIIKLYDPESSGIMG